MKDPRRSSRATSKTDAVEIDQLMGLLMGGYRQEEDSGVEIWFSDSVAKYAGLLIGWVESMSMKIR